MRKVNAAEVRAARVAPLGAVPGTKVRITDDFSFTAGMKKGEKRGLNKDTVVAEVPPCLCGEAVTAYEPNGRKGEY